jgi:hypothetical protein
MQQIQASEETLDKIFSSDFDFEIPNYQRAYAWRTEETSQLLDDLDDGLEAASDEPYFLGSIVLVKEPGSPAAKVIDGQQRLTTLTIVLAVLRDLSADEPERANALAVRIAEPGDPVMQRTPKPRLSLRERDRPFFRHWVQEPDNIVGLLAVKDDGLTGEAQRNIRNNATAMQGALNQWPAERRNALATMLLARTFLVTVRTQDLRSAHRIFSVMNSRGLDLTAPDIFKSDVIGAIPDGSSDEYTKRWEDAEDEVGRDGFEELFLHLRLIHAKERARQSLLVEFPTQVLDRYLPDQAKEFVDDVVAPYSHAFAEVTRAAYSSVAGADKVNAWLRRLGQLDTTDWQAPALWALRHRGDDPQWLDDFLRRLERLAASMYIRRVHVSPRSTRYVDLLRQLDDGNGLDAAAFDLTAEERQDTLGRLDGDIYLTTKTRRYILERLDEVLADNPGVTYDHKIITVEHVLPQNPKANSQWFAAFTEEQRLVWTHRLANLVLLNQAKNAQAQNYDFDEKKRRYFASSLGTATFALTSQVLNHPTWTPHVLEERQAELVEALVGEWVLHEPS